MRSKFRSSFRLRLTFMVLLSILIPVLGILIYVTYLGFQNIEETARGELEIQSGILSDAVENWDDVVTTAVTNLSQQPVIVSMNPDQQEASLVSMANVYTDMYLIAITDDNGQNIARSDGGNLTDYSDRDWFRGAMTGNEITRQSLIGRTSGEPAITYSAPIRNAEGDIIGVTLAATDLDTLAESVGAARFSGNGFAFLVDADGKVLAHPDPEFTSGELVDLSTFPPVAYALAGEEGPGNFTDEDGLDWFIYTQPLANGWAIVVQQEVSEALAQLPSLITTAAALGLFIMAVIGLLVWWVAGRAVRPILTLTAAATTIASGKLDEEVEIKQHDEIGTLAAAFNSMTAQLRNLVDKLEQRVAARIHDLQLANQIGQNVAEIRDADQLLAEAVKIIRDDFDLYLAQIYLVEEDEESLLLQAAEGQAANRLLEQRHFLSINTASINGTAVTEKRPVVVSDTAKDPRFRPNPLLPNTRSEMAVPLLSADKVIGILDVQSTVPDAFTEENVPAFTAMAGQLTIALENAALFSEREQTATELENVLTDTEKQAKRLAALNEMGTKLASVSKIEDVYQIVSSQILSLIEGERASIALVTEAGQSVEVLALEGEKGALPTGTTLPLTGTAIGLAIRENRIVQLPKETPMSTYADSRQLAQQGLQSTLITPLIASRGIIGTLNIANIQPYAFTEGDISLVQQAATLLATTIDSMNLVERVQNLASIVESHPDFIGIASLDGDALYANPAGLALMGLPADYDITGMSALDFFVEEDAQRLIQEGVPNALETGFWTAEMQLLTIDGTIIPVEQTIAINYDVEGNALSFSTTMRDITERQEAEESQRRLNTQLEERLLQVNAMQRAMTHEGWSAFLTSDKRLVQGFKFDNEQIHLISTNDLLKGNMPAPIANEADEQPTSPETAVAPVEVRGERVGVIGARNPDGKPLTKEQLAILDAMSQQVADALDRARLFEEMELAREQMNALYSGSEQVVQARSLDGVLDAIVDHTSLKNLEQIDLMFFDSPWRSNPPNTITVGAMWLRKGQQPKSLSDSTIDLQQFPLLSHLDRENPFVCEDIEKDERLDEESRALISNVLKVRSILIFPLITGGQWIGIVLGQASTPQTFSLEQIRQISSLVSQAATVSQTQRLFEQTQSRARREQLLREITAKVYAAPDAETIMKTAVKEVNRIMGVDSFVYLDDQSLAKNQPGNGHHLETEDPAFQEG
jgi:PAS domain S-box-containing protein